MSGLTTKTQNESTYTENMKNIYRIAFDSFDKDKDGIITFEECGDVFKSLGYDLSENEIEDLIFQAHKHERLKNETCINTNNNNTIITDGITLKQFLAIMNTWKKERDISEEYYEAFKVFDFKGNGTIDIDILKHILLEYSENISKDDIEYMLNDADISENGTIDYRNFINLLLNK